MNRTEIKINATAFNEGERPIEPNNQKITFSYCDINKGKRVTMTMSDGRVNYPLFQFVIDQAELERVLEFLKSAKQ